MSIAIVILAAGSSKRYNLSIGNKGQSKLSSDFRGRPLISLVLETVAEVKCDERIVVVKDESLDYLISDDFTILVNHSAELGLASSLNIAIHYASIQNHSAVVIALGDMPFLVSESFKRVIEEESTPIVATTYGQKVAHPIKISRELFFKLPTTGDIGGKHLIANFPSLVTLVEGTGSSTDIDTKEDFIKWS